MVTWVCCSEVSLVIDALQVDLGGLFSGGDGLFFHFDSLCFSLLLKALLFELLPTSVFFILSTLALRFSKPLALLVRSCCTLPFSPLLSLTHLLFLPLAEL